MPDKYADLIALTTDRIDLAFPLAREADRSLSIEDWRDFAEPRVATDPSARRRSGILLAARNSLIRGLAAYDVSDASEQNRVLKVSRVVVADRTRERHLEMDLLGGLLGIAETARCRRVCAELPAPSRWLRPRWSDPGGRVFRLPVECFALPDTRPSQSATEVVTLRPRH